MINKLNEAQEFLMRLKKLNKKAFICHNQAEGSIWIESLNQKCIVLTCSDDSFKRRELEDFIVKYCEALGISFELILEN